MAAEVWKWGRQWSLLFQRVSGLALRSFPYTSTQPFPRHILWVADPAWLLSPTLKLLPLPKPSFRAALKSHSMPSQVQLITCLIMLVPDPSQEVRYHYDSSLSSHDQFTKYLNFSTSEKERTSMVEHRFQASVGTWERGNWEVGTEKPGVGSATSTFCTGE